MTLVATASALGVVAGRASATLTTGAIEGRVTDAATGTPIAGAVVTARGPALAGEQTELSDADGRFIITQLPPGEYLVEFERGGVTVARPGVLVGADKTLVVNGALPPPRAEHKRYLSVVRAPNVELGNTQLQTEIRAELAHSIPVRGRTYDSLLTLAPGATTEPFGFSFNGATSPENSFLVDGLNTTNPTFGLLGTRLSLEFIKETLIITGGYNAEYGRATGAVASVITKSGEDTFHGGVWLYYAPLSLTPNTVARVGEAIAGVQRGGAPSRFDHAFDLGFELGGPLWKDHVRFYLGLAPSFVSQSYDRILRARTADQLPAGMTSGSYDGDLQANQPGQFVTRELAGRARHFKSESRLYNVIAKLDFRFNDDHRLTVQYIASPSTFSGVFDNPNNPVSPGNPFFANFNLHPDAMPFDNTIQVHDLLLHFVSKLADHKLQLDVLAGYHRESDSIVPGPNGNRAGINLDLRQSPLSRFEDVPECARQMIHGVSFSPCPVSGYLDGGFGFLADTVTDRLALSASATYFARLWGTHTIKLGGDFEMNRYSHHQYFTGGATGGRFITLEAAGMTLVQRRQFATVDPMDPSGTRVLLEPNGFDVTTRTLDESLYLRDSYRVGTVPGLTINAGLRWEPQQAQDDAGHTQISLLDNLAPRIGLIYDWTRQGRSKLYASYGRFYESLPLDVNDHEFTTVGVAKQTTTADNCQVDARGRIDTSTCQFPAARPRNLIGGSYAAVAPSIKGQYSNEMVAGLQYDVGLDLVLGAAYVHRDLGRVIEDSSPDGQNFIIGNPGDAVDSGAVANLEERINRLNGQIAATSDAARRAALVQQKTSAIQTLSLYQGLATFPRPRRDYNALVLTAQKRLSHHFILLASYTYSRTLGNYPGLYNASYGQLNPNTSIQFDYKELLVNADGPLPTDRPHNLKVAGAYDLPIGAHGWLTFGLNFNVLSGRPIEVLGNQVSSGPRAAFILPRGSGGRTPTLTSFDLHLAWGQIVGPSRIELSWDIFNLFDQQGVTQVDDVYTSDPVIPIGNGTGADLVNLRNAFGLPVTRNPNYGRPTAYQSPLSMRFGVRASF